MSIGQTYLEVVGGESGEQEHLQGSGGVLSGLTGVKSGQIWPKSMRYKESANIYASFWFLHRVKV